jgi:hypothetical protein
MNVSQIYTGRARAAGAVILLGALVAAPLRGSFAQAAATTQAVGAPRAADIQRVLNAAYSKYKDLHEGKNADYIPALAKVNPDLFGIALVTPEGQVFVAGDTTTEVSIQSISKVFTLARVLRACHSTRSSPSSRRKATR